MTTLLKDLVYQKHYLDNFSQTSPSGVQELERRQSVVFFVFLPVGLHKLQRSDMLAPIRPGPVSDNQSDAPGTCMMILPLLAAWYATSYRSFAASINMFLLLASLSPNIIPSRLFLDHVASMSSFGHGTQYAPFLGFRRLSLFSLFQHLATV